MNLFIPRAKENRLHPYFIRLISEKRYESARKVIEGWSVGLSDRKKESAKFVNEFQTTFNSSLWELYLNQVFIELGFKIKPRQKNSWVVLGTGKAPSA